MLFMTDNSVALLIIFRSTALWFCIVGRSVEKKAGRYWQWWCFNDNVLFLSNVLQTPVWLAGLSRGGLVMIARSVVPPMDVTRTCVATPAVRSYFYVWRSVIFYWSSGIVDCMLFTFEYWSPTRALGEGPWRGIFYFHLWTASIKLRLLYPPCRLCFIINRTSLFK